MHWVYRANCSVPVLLRLLLNLNSISSSLRSSIVAWDHSCYEYVTAALTLRRCPITGTWPSGPDLSGILLFRTQDIDDALTKKTVIELLARSITVRRDANGR